MAPTPVFKGRATAVRGASRIPYGSGRIGPIGWSQTTALIADDPTAFRLSNAMLANFHRPNEIHFEPVVSRVATDGHGAG
jgi:hypothetical protein